MKRNDVFARKLPVQVAYHLHCMLTISKEYLSAISHIKTRTPDSMVEFSSSVTGRRAEASDLGSLYWVSNLLGEVKFADSLLHLVLEATSAKQPQRFTPRLKLDLTPDWVARSSRFSRLNLVSETTLSSTRPRFVRNSNTVETTLLLVSKLLIAGYAVTLVECNGLTGGKSHSVLVDLPSYVWNRSKNFKAQQGLYPRIDLLSLPDRGTNPLEPRWGIVIRASTILWIKDYKIQTNIIY